VEYVAALYAKQPKEGSAGLSTNDLIDLGNVAGIDPGPFGECVRSGRHAGRVDALTEDAVKMGVRGTPTVLVNGKPVSPDPQAVTDAVAAAT
jgi:protein-disulfide isomerase